MNSSVNCKDFSLVSHTSRKENVGAKLLGKPFFVQVVIRFRVYKIVNKYANTMQYNQSG